MNRKFRTLTLCSVKALACAVLASSTFAAGAGRGAVPTAAARGGARGVPAGPPATVPAEVAIPRPSADELAKINAALVRFVETSTSPDKDLLRKYQSLINVPAPRVNSAILPAPSARAARHQGFVDIANTGDFDILFVGDSITDFWQRDPPDGGSAMMKKYFGDVKVANFAVSGDTIQGNIWGLKNGEGQGHKPKAVMLMIGTNNAGPNTAAEMAEGIGALVLELRNDFPDAKILLLGIFPGGAGPTDPYRIKKEETNKLIAKLDDHKHVFYMNINSKFLNEQGALIGFRPDNTHPMEKGYDIWGAAVADTLKSWIK